MSTATASKENYLKTILRIERERGYVRASEIAEYMKVTRPSVSTAVHQLEQLEYILIHSDHSISLTPTGLKLAETVLDRYETFFRFFISLGVPGDIASVDAGRIEHAISDDTFMLFKKTVAI